MLHKLTRDKLPLTPREKRTHTSYILLIFITMTFTFTITSCAVMGDAYSDETVIFSPYIPLSEARAEKRLEKKVKTSMKKETKKYETKAKTIREVSAYNAGDPYQTDSSPCISASGDNICDLLEDGILVCAANFVPINSYLRIDNYGICKVLDRMNSRYPNGVDVAMKVTEKERAKQFGRQNLLVEVIEYK